MPCGFCWINSLILIGHFTSWVYLCLIVGNKCVLFRCFFLGENSPNVLGHKLENSQNSLVVKSLTKWWFSWEYIREFPVYEPILFRRHTVSYSSRGFFGITLTTDFIPFRAKSPRFSGWSCQICCLLTYFEGSFQG